MRLIGLVLLLLGNGYALWAMDTLIWNGDLLADSFSVVGSMPIAKYALVAFLFTLVNSLLRPVLFLVSVPLRFLTMGMFSFVLNAGLLWAVQQAVDFIAIGDIRLVVTGILTYLVAGLVMAVVSHILHWFT